MLERGAIYNRHRAKQLVDFRGLKFDTITPTDLDGFIDFGNEQFVFLEFKREGAEMPYGQRLALERLVQACRVPAWLLLGSHLYDGDIDAAQCRLKGVYHAGTWREPPREMLVRDAVDFILKLNRRQ